MIGSKTSIVSGRVTVWTRVKAASAFSSCGAKYRLHPVSFRSFRACFFNKTGANVSVQLLLAKPHYERLIFLPDKNRSAVQVIPQIIKSIRKVQRQPYCTEQPEMIGPIIGPKLEAFAALSISKVEVQLRCHDLPTCIRPLHGHDSAYPRTYPRILRQKQFVEQRP